ncbi:ABC transporter ATP-binding protein [Mobilicoccus massiliensis]|uniref:ABC transporter ATP-binding protein n=1 Tax=Mobilicoccus massiliensis TaxID=1522310 RepID=UPI0006933559|nr:ABC transporter ATP-binding protein [Mobilicoccus massiliensis]
MTTTHPADEPSATRHDHPAIELRGLTKTFAPPRGATAPVEAVRDVDLRIERGEVVALLGPNGAGKTSLLDMVLGFTAPTSGSVSVLGRRPADVIATGGISSVLQSGGLLPRLTVGETLTMVADVFGRHADVPSVARRAGIEQILTRRVSKCSGGEQQRLRFALALLPDPDLLLLDEPTTGLDVGARRDFWSAIRADAKRGRTILFATHYLAEADDIADRIVLMRDGEIVADDTPGRIKGTALGRHVRATLPDSSEDEALAVLRGVNSFERRGEVVRLHTRDSDALARHLLTATAARDVEVTSDALEDAFLTLTSTPTSTTTPITTLTNSEARS